MIISASIADKSAWLHLSLPHEPLLRFRELDVGNETFNVEELKKLQVVLHSRFPHKAPSEERPTVDGRATVGDSRCGKGDAARAGVRRGEGDAGDTILG